jgi:cell division protein FtsQ
LGFDTQSIIIEGRAKTPQAVIEQALGVKRGDPILTVSLADARRHIEAIPWVRSAVVSRVLPHTIRIVLDERSPFAVWQNRGNFTLIDQAGNVVSDADIASFVNVLPLVVGEGAPIDAARLLTAYAKYHPLNGRMMAAIRVGGRRWDLCMSNGAIVQLPEGAEDQALSRLADLQTDKQLLDRPLQEIDMRLPDRLRVRPMTETPCGHAPSASNPEDEKSGQRKPA